MNDQRHKLVQDLRTGRDKEGTPSRDRPKTESTNGGRRDMAALIGPWYTRVLEWITLEKTVKYKML